ncbi:hypothetical protein E5F05_19335 [Deinococcus metallilatus]|uniref:Uncharacterized protein n=1 Tax=Deinococcus metallilatus TaxID=1211322 RepID=A0AAJ5F788_9DEIO|nr:hypothetical protein [Deinococcus metallilatus]MBB5296426.1 hypothetical protein [Deinococcus metallilatus]QBY09904.1 hypothetical protein E5F05_19335 [Deinococcus metallilatus]RXJ08628.1 hypothetical protein ERJ73_18175 [Deinococcus metallilatus]TLK25102.1 hypothetical protein FCS05_13090 [Deinococcus metallilatus]
MPRFHPLKSVLRLLALLGLLPTALAQGRLLPPDPAILRYPLLTPASGQAADVTLLFSDSPETPGQSGLLYRDRVSGQVRVLAYHANGLGRPARLFILARNPGDAPATFTTRRRGSASTPGPDPVIGQQTLLRYFASAPLSPHPLGPGEQAVLFSSDPLAPDAVASVMLDLDLSAPLELSVVMLGEGEWPTPSVLAGLPSLARDRHQRGTFAGANRLWRVDLGPLPARLVLGAQNDPPLHGTDALTGDPQLLAGNYGVLYELELRGAGGSLLTLAPRGGVYRGALWLRDGGRAGPLLIGQGAALKDPARPAWLWQARSDRLDLLFVPANGSNLPVALVFYPSSWPQPVP